MADNVTVDNGSGTDYTAATDDDGTAHHPYVKVEWGADNTQTKVAAGAAALPIQDGGNSITVDGTVAVSGTVTVDGSGVTQPVSAASLPLPTGAATAAKQPVLGTAGTASADVITVQGVTSMTALKVDGSGVTQPVSGTVAVTGVATAANQTTLIGHVDGVETLLGTIDADTSTLAGAVSGTEMQVDVLTLPALAAGTNNIGDVDVLTLPDQAHRLSAYETLATPLDTELDSIANGSLTAASAAIDNTTLRHRHCAFTLTLGAQTARTAGASLAIYRNDAVDGTNYDTVDASAPLVAVIPLPTGTGAGQWTRVVRNCLTPGLFKFFAGNNSTQTTAASANLLEIRMFSDEIG